jgi:hypothetical protein
VRPKPKSWFCVTKLSLSPSCRAKGRIMLINLTLCGGGATRTPFAAAVRPVRHPRHGRSGHGLRGTTQQQGKEEA